MKKQLKLVTDPPSTSARPPRNQGEPPHDLGPIGLDFWQKVVREYCFDDVGSLALLELACRALDRAETLRQRIDKDGELIPSPNGMKAHPLLREELGNRTFIARTLQRLGLDREPVLPVGRPPRGIA
jgi:hypothetical protein